MPSNRVAVLDGSTTPTGSTLQWFRRIYGIMNVALCIAMSVVHLQLLSSSTRNDYFWADFNSSGTQSFLSDVYNRQVGAQTYGSISLFDRTSAQEKDYSNLQTLITIQATSPRRMIMEVMDNLIVAINGMRVQTLSQTVAPISCYCWLDFERGWEVAHTAKRQIRCHERYANNAIFYMEATLRNVDWAKWYQMFSDEFDTAYGNAIYESPGGNAWLERTRTALSQFTVLDEAKYWKKFNITRYIVPWHNCYVGGFDYSLTLKNAIQTFSLPLNHVQYHSEDALWTSVIASFGISNDFYYAKTVNSSLVRNASNSFTLLSEADGPEIWTGGYPNTAWSIVLHDIIGPFSAIDLFFVLPPQSLVEICENLDRLLIVDLQVYEAHVKDYIKIGTISLDFLPPSWNSSNISEFYGGNVFCYDGQMQSYPQQSFGFDDACTEPKPALTIDLDYRSIIFALAMSPPSAIDVKSICQLSLTKAESCRRILDAATKLYASQSSIVTSDYPQTSTVVTDLLQLNVTLMQYAMQTSTPALLFQSIVDPSNPSWSFYGWLHVADWLHGVREVVSFEGDTSTACVISQQYSASSFTLNPLQVPTRFSFAIWVLILYIYGIFICVIILGIASALLNPEFTWSGWNLANSSRVVGLIWIGRPLLMLRGMMAMILLSSANIKLETSNGFTYFVVSPRSFVDIFVLSGETLWLTYAVADILALATSRHSLHCALGSAAISWSVAFLLEVASPFTPVAQLVPTCDALDMDTQVNCVAGTIEIGSPGRFRFLCILQVCTVIFAMVLSKLSKFAKQSQAAPVIVPSVAAVCFEMEDSENESLDILSSVLCGLLPFKLHGRGYVFSVLLWMNILSAPSEVTSMNRGEAMASVVFHVPELKLQTNCLFTKRPVHVPTPSKSHARQSWIAGAGLAFLLVSASSSLSFFFVSNSRLTNDFLWQGFNSSGMQAFLIDWYNFELMFHPSGMVELDMHDVNRTSTYNTTQTPIRASSLYASSLVFESITLSQVIEGLRKMDGCDAPWIANQYCFVDFERTWELASTSFRQQRCANYYVKNAAVYIEPILRNVEKTGLHRCWGLALELGLYQDLRETSRGQDWLKAVVDESFLSVEEEAALWVSKGITSYTTQWQNYKSIGLLETFEVYSALGVSYALTLKRSNGTYRFDLQTSWKMYWGWGNDLRAVFQLNATSGISRSLIRASSRYIYANESMEASLIAWGILESPLDAGLTLTKNFLGPFGSVDTIHVSCPQEMFHLYRRFNAEVNRAMMESNEAQEPVVNPDLAFPVVPSPWLANYESTYGGSHICGVHSGGTAMSIGILTWLSRYSTCATITGEYCSASHFTVLLGLVSGGFMAECTTCLSIADDICSKVIQPATTCTTHLTSVYNWTRTFMSPNVIRSLHEDALKVKALILDLDINIVQFATANSSSPHELLQLNLLSDRPFEVFGWILVSDWTKGAREVVQFVGDDRTVSVLSSYAVFSSAVPNPLEVPSNLVYYWSLCIQYTTSAVFGITAIAILYTFLNYGHVEGRNMLEVNRVAGIVWVGRPLLCLRSLVAICFLSTASVELRVANTFTTLVVPSASGFEWLTTALAGSEASWLVVVLSDLFMAATRDWTNNYSFLATTIVIIVSIGLSLINPVVPVFSINRECTTAHVDMQLECTSGQVYIGSVERLLTLVALAVGVMIICFLIERMRRPNFSIPSHRPSLLLPAGAHFLYHKEPWIYDDILYLDKASAFLCGLLALQWKNSIYFLDVKTWRAHKIDVDNEFNPQALAADEYSQRSIKMAVPMVE